MHRAHNSDQIARGKPRRLDLSAIPGHRDLRSDRVRCSYASGVERRSTLRPFNNDVETQQQRAITRESPIGLSSDSSLDNSDIHRSTFPGG